MTLFPFPFPEQALAGMDCPLAWLAQLSQVSQVPSSPPAPPALQAMPLAQLPLWVSQGFLETLGVAATVRGQEHVPTQGPVLVVSNHRSFMDPPLVMYALQRAVHFACHPYMEHVPLVRELVRGLGGFPLSGEGSPHRQLFEQAATLLGQNHAVGVFPEGAAPMVKFTHPAELSPFQRGFAHLALRVPVPELHILPVAIAARKESHGNAVPLQLLSLFDPSEPLFDQSGWHPAIVYRQVELLVGQPITITAAERSQYQGREARILAQRLTQRVEQDIAAMLRQAL